MNRPLRIWLPTIRAESGADIFVERLAKGLERAGQEPIVQWFDHRYELMPELMRFHSKPRHVDVVHANSWSACAFLAQGLPLVTTVLHLVHDPAYAPYRSKAQAVYHRYHLRWRESRAIKKSAAVTAISGYVGETVKNEFGRELVRIIPNWVDTNVYKPGSGYALPSERRFRLLMVGNHSRRKGSDLLPAFAAALGGNFDLRCTGGLRGQSDLESLDNLTLLGRLSEKELLKEYQDCDAVVSLSRYEGFGYTALEGMACGKPFVGFNTSGLKEVVDDSRTGFLEPIDDVSLLAKRCSQLSINRDLLKEFGIAGRNRALKKFDEKMLIDSYIDLYKDVILNR